MRFGVRTFIRYQGGEIRIRTGVEDYIVQSLDQMVKRSEDLRIPFERFKPHWANAVKRAFDNEGEPVPWDALTLDYASWKLTQIGEKPILQLSGEMYDSMVSQTGDSIWEVGPRHIKYGSRVPYFIYHEEGTRNMPARPMLTLPPEAAAMLNTLVFDYIGEKI